MPDSEDEDEEEDVPSIPSSPTVSAWMQKLSQKAGPSTTLSDTTPEKVVLPQKRNYVSDSEDEDSDA